MKRTTILSCIIVGIFYALPLLLLLSSSLRPESEIVMLGTKLSIFSFLPQRPSLEAFSVALNRPYFEIQVINTFAIGVIQATVVLAIAFSAAFASMRIGGTSVKIMLPIVYFSILIPYTALLVPIYEIVRTLNLVNSWSGLIMPWLASPVSFFLLREAIKKLPAEVVDAALLDGAGPLRVMLQIIAPNIRQPIVTIWVINLIGVYDSLLWPLITITDPSRQIVQANIASFFSSWERPAYSVAFAASLLAFAPVICLLPAFKYLAKHDRTTRK